MKTVKMKYFDSYLFVSFNLTLPMHYGKENAVTRMGFLLKKDGGLWN